ncbi:hypothetical protein PZA11_004391 [Diplocarpon coronariae]|uniref:Uncharacterized protein n=1 Tax=Diplocarpon coronariae TaxID=2795749 RepID=A0A218YTZ0_9HELO|nr:hypothetical protein JHW43_003040 [Diplocarpon mali]OWO97481.1 hypothetical protein B2J93_9102 [Marssonina coronariae]
MEAPLSSPSRLQRQALTLTQQQQQQQQPPPPPPYSAYPSSTTPTSGPTSAAQSQQHHAQQIPPQAAAQPRSNDTASPFLRDFNLVAEAAKRAQMACLMRDLEGVAI